MGYINDQTITIDAVLTRRGRELLSSGEGTFKINKWALSDDGVDYRLWDNLGQPNPLNGTDMRGHAIEAMPILEPNPSGVRHLRNKLIKKLDRQTDRLPIMWLGALPIAALPSTSLGLDNVLNFQIDTNDKGFVLIPRKLAAGIGNIPYFAPMGYTAIVRDANIISISGNSSADITGMNWFTFVPSEDIKPTIGTLNGKKTATVSALWGFNIRPMAWPGPVGQKKSTTIFIYDNETGVNVIVTFEIELKATYVLVPGPGNPQPSDIRLKKNIEYIGKSNMGINIYGFEYINPSYGTGRFQGVMAQEVPFASVKNNRGYYSVDYSLVDVEYKRIEKV